MLSCQGLKVVIVVRCAGRDNERPAELGVLLGESRPMPRLDPVMRTVAAWATVLFTIANTTAAVRKKRMRKLQRLMFRTVVVSRRNDNKPQSLRSLGPRSQKSCR